MDRRAVWYKEPLVWLIIAFPTLAVIGGVITIVLAVGSDDGVVVDDYYRRGLAINRELARDRLAKAYGLSADLSIQKKQATDTIEVRLQANAAFTYPRVLSLSFFHATRPGFDQTTVLVYRGAGLYTGDIDELIPGKWNIEFGNQHWRVVDSYRL